MRQPTGPVRGPDDGATAVEYGLLLSGVAALIILAVTVFGGQVDALFSQVTNLL